MQTRSNPWSHLAALIYDINKKKTKPKTKPTRHHTPGIKWKCSANINELKGQTIQLALAVTQAPSTSAIWIINWYWRQWATNICYEVSVRVAGIVGIYMLFFSLFFFNFKKWNLKIMQLCYFVEKVTLLFSVHYIIKLIQLFSWIALVTWFLFYV